MEARGGRGKRENHTAFSNTGTRKTCTVIVGILKERYRMRHKFWKVLPKAQISQLQIQGTLPCFHTFIHPLQAVTSDLFSTL